MRGKGKRASMRLGKKEIYGKISELFNTNPDKSYTSREIFEELGITSHTQRIMCCDILYDLVDADELTVRDDKYSVSRKNQVVEGKFVRKVITAWFPTTAESQFLLRNATVWVR